MLRLCAMLAHSIFYMINYYNTDPLCGRSTRERSPHHHTIRHPNTYRHFLYLVIVPISRCSSETLTELDLRITLVAPPWLTRIRTRFKYFTCNDIRSSGAMWVLWLLWAIFPSPLFKVLAWSEVQSMHQHHDIGQQGDVYMMVIHNLFSFTNSIIQSDQVLRRLPCQSSCLA